MLTFFFQNHQKAAKTAAPLPPANRPQATHPRGRDGANTAASNFPITKTCAVTNASTKAFELRVNIAQCLSRRAAISRNIYAVYIQPVSMNAAFACGTFPLRSSYRSICKRIIRIWAIIGISWIIKSWTISKRSILYWIKPNRCDWRVCDTIETTIMPSSSHVPCAKSGLLITPICVVTGAWHTCAISWIRSKLASEEVSECMKVRPLFERGRR